MLHITARRRVEALQPRLCGLTGDAEAVDQPGPPPAGRRRRLRRHRAARARREHHRRGARAAAHVAREVAQRVRHGRGDRRGARARQRPGRQDGRHRLPPPRQDEDEALPPRLRLRAGVDAGGGVRGDGAAARAEGGRGLQRVLLRVRRDRRRQDLHDDGDARRPRRDPADARRPRARRGGAEGGVRREDLDAVRRDLQREAQGPAQPVGRRPRRPRGAVEGHLRRRRHRQGGRHVRRDDGAHSRSAPRNSAQFAAQFDGAPPTPSTQSHQAATSSAPPRRPTATRPRRARTRCSSSPCTRSRGSRRRRPSWGSSR